MRILANPPGFCASRILAKKCSDCGLYLVENRPTPEKLKDLPR